MAGARFTKSARKHRIGKASAIYVMANAMPEFVPASGGFDPRIVWIGDDERGRELEVVALDLPDGPVVIHVMPTHYRGR